MRGANPFVGLCVAWSPSRAHVAVGGVWKGPDEEDMLPPFGSPEDVGGVVVFAAATGAVELVAEAGGRVMSLAWAASGTRLAAATRTFRAATFASAFARFACSFAVISVAVVLSSPAAAARPSPAGAAAPPSSSSRQGALFDRRT